MIVLRAVADLSNAVPESVWVMACLALAGITLTLVLERGGRRG